MSDLAADRLRRAAAEVSATWVVLRVVSQATEFAAWLLLARRLELDEVGAVAMAYLVCRYVGLVADLASPFAGVRLVAGGASPDDVASLARARTTLTVLGAVVTAAVLVVVDADLAPLAVVIGFRGMNRDWIALGQGRQAAAAVPPFIASASLLAGAATTTTPAAFAAVAAGGHAIAIVASLVVNRTGRPSAPVGKTVRSYGWITTVVLADQLYQSSDVLVVGALLGADDAGVYSTLYRFPAAWIGVVGLLSAGWLRSATVRGQDDEGHRANVRRALRAVRIVVVATCGLAVAVWFLVPALLGEPFDDHRGTAVVLAVGAGAATVAAPLSTVYLTRRSDRRLAQVNLVIAALNVTGCLVLVPLFELPGAATMTVVAYVVLATFYWRAVGSGGAAPVPEA